MNRSNLRGYGLQVVTFAVVSMILARPTQLFGQDQAPTEVKADADTPAAAYMLQFSGSEHVVIPELTYDGSHPITLEAFVIYTPWPPTSRLATVVGNLQGSGLGLQVVQDRWAFHVNDGRRGNLGYVSIGSNGRAVRNTPVHIAGVFDGSKVTMYVDGRIQRSAGKTAAEHKMSEWRFMVGGDPDGKGNAQSFFKGLIDEVRISKIARYTGDFSLPGKLESDENTLVLYRFDEGKGDLANDASGNDRHGKIHGAKWVKGRATPLAYAPLDAGQVKLRQKASAKHLGVPVEFSNSIGMKFRLIPAGDYLMGTDEAELRLLPLKDWFFKGWAVERMRGEMPKHRVRITRPYYCGIHEVTVGQFKKFVEAIEYQSDAERTPDGGFGWTPRGWEQGPKYDWRNPGFEQTEMHPVGNVSWNDAVAFCHWLSKQEKATYRLPTEAEWEYACRAGTDTWFNNGQQIEGLQAVANIADASLQEKHPLFDWARPWHDGFPFTAPVGSFEPNAFGLFDMHGNVWEWCSDWYDTGYYAESPTDDPTGPETRTGGYHVFRGGGWDNYPGFCRSADRYSSHSPTLRSQWAGFRVVIGDDLSGIGKEPQAEGRRQVGE